ncbi:MAG: L-histidine N(alpha)-methyltransferase [Bacteroidota bacterium]|nr:L-histidine N(alpha)-methyltransferase [Bacteroidota bacterium]
MSEFLKDVVQGLSAEEKVLQSKYFYDAKGDVLFQKIMACKEYYPTRCEMEIFTQQTGELVHVLTGEKHEFDIVELGAGDATKSIHLLKGLLNNQVAFTYYPVDISNNVIGQLKQNLPLQLPGLKLQALNGEYFQMLEKAKTLSDKIKVVLFLGGNIGNVALEKAGEFSKSLRQHLNTGDLVLVGFDLKKDPKTILDAYNDSTGLTRDFNLNLLERINRELQGNFDLNNFYHYATYDPQNGATKSYLVSKKKQTVSVAGKDFYFKTGEPIFMEISQKYTVEQTDDLARQTGFQPVHHLLDTKGWFLDAVWKCV